MIHFNPKVKGTCYVLLVLLLYLNACKKETDPEFSPGTNAFINDWVMDSMKVYYYWNNSLPAKPDYDQEPLQFFSAIKNKTDRFSQLINPDVPESYPRTLYSDFGIDLVTLSSAGKDQTIIRLVVPGSDGYQAGLKRGDTVLSINGTAVTASNISALTEASLKQGSITLDVEGKPGPYKIDGYLKPGPVYTTQVWEKGGKKTGYIFLNNFDIRALSKLKEVFAGFQGRQVNELILDLRYNTGGEVSVAAALAAMICQAGQEAIFLEYRGNSLAGVQRHSFGYEISRLITPLNYSQYTSLRLNINRVFLITGNHTASAAELLANNLPPHIPTIRIGEKTLGKDMAEYELADHRKPQLAGRWVIWPLVFKIYNSAGIGDYTDGLPPDVEADELSVLPLKQLGDPEETLTQKALAQITGIKASVRGRAAAEKAHRLYDSRDKDDRMPSPIRVRR
ncbi:C-terminal processing protease CtpA/Prc [Arcticibacter tournemirensis]|uniref:PDZ domain-containing protein n=1 Tax=Arcticibacter tournemirensis TaxID=699437 RepID=A0A5M9HK51_9SPHI|nr:S41 family peptidase [Arcticibacter tournemirensis]KAA8485367.1 hypothetical protein F1649_04415 [Arcticibacter tournemirensis]TQM50344.1 C-terminal processing protease CtpA/Prc [Arcticibacter tournemirensis]